MENDRAFQIIFLFSKKINLSVSRNSVIVGRHFQLFMLSLNIIGHFYNSVLSSLNKNVDTKSSRGEVY